MVKNKSPSVSKKVTQKKSKSPKGKSKSKSKSGSKTKSNISKNQLEKLSSNELKTIAKKLEIPLYNNMTDKEFEKFCIYRYGTKMPFKIEVLDLV